MAGPVAGEAWGVSAPGGQKYPNRPTNGSLASNKSLACEAVSALAEIETALGDIAARCGPSVVGLGRGWGSGSGVVIAPGQVLTAAHVVTGDPLAVAFQDGTRREASVAGTDPDLDLAVLDVDTGAAPALAWSEREPRLGLAVIALADPGGRGLRATLGFVSATERSFRGRGGRRIAGAIEHTAPLPRGSAGGPLLDTDGAVLGLNAVRAEGGLILAARADSALRERVAALARGEAPRQVRLGVALAPPGAARELRRAVGLPDREGLLVRGVQDGSPAAGAGVRRGDLIVSAGRHEAVGIDALRAALEAARPGAPLELGIVRGSEELTVPVRLP